MEQKQVEESKTYECGLRFNAQPLEHYPIIENVANGLVGDQKYRSGQWTPFGASKQDAQVNFQVPMTKMDWDMKLPVATKDYELTEEENKAFDSLEGCTPEEIAIAKQVLCKTIQVPDDGIKWKDVRKVKGTGINSYPFHAHKLPVGEVQEKLYQLDNLKNQLIASMQCGGAKLGQVMNVMQATTPEQMKMAFDSDIFEKGDIITDEISGEKWEVE